MSDLRGNDAIVVGGGLAGLTAAALLARAGRRVVLLERSATVGGRAISHVEKGFHLNLGPHAWYVGGPGTRVLQELGITLPGRPPRTSGGFALYQGRMHTLPVGFVSLLTTDLLGVHGKLEAARLLAALARMDTGRFDGVSLSDWLGEHVSDTRARAVLEMFVRVASYTHAPDLLSAGAGLGAMQSVLRHNVLYVHGGWQSIVAALRAKAGALGVRLVTGAPVTEVLHDSGAEGVRLEDGTAVLAPQVIVAGTPAMVRHLLPHAPEPAAVRWSPTPSRAACLDLALAKLPKASALVAFGIDQPLYYSVHSAVADLAPHGGAVVHVAKYLNPSQAADAKADERELEAFMDRLQPGWRAEVVVRRYFPSMTVTNGIPTAAGGGLAGRAPVRISGIEGVYLAGDWVGAEGTLANAAVASAAQAARLITGQAQAVTTAA
uniref:Amine oxidase flavin-containing protein n=1 Tax=uncultured bacterium 98 TaxID=698395 RepID=E3T6K9_9BACT|nr:amine oxidase flavin-containing protein [uncultured bacterium 98]